MIYIIKSISYGAKKILVRFIALTPFLSLAFLFSSSFMRILLVLTMIEVFNAFTIPAFQSVMARLIPKNYRGRALSALGIGMFYVDVRGIAIGHGVLLFIPGMFSFTVGGILYELNATYPFLFMTVGSLLIAFTAFKLLPNKKRTS